MTPPDHPDPWVDHAARYTYDYNYNGAGNWPFNVAYAHTFGLEGAVTQLRSLAEAEQYIKAGIPLVASLSFGSGKLDGFPFKSTNGHLLTIVGFTASGDVVSNDPAALTDADVQRTYNRAQFEQAWMESTGGLVYLLYAPGTIASLGRVEVQLGELAYACRRDPVALLPDQRVLAIVQQEARA